MPTSGGLFQVSQHTVEGVQARAVMSAPALQHCSRTQADAVRPVSKEPSHSRPGGRPSAGEPDHTHFEPLRRIASKRSAAPELPRSRRRGSEAGPAGGGGCAPARKPQIRPRGSNTTGGEQPKRSRASPLQSGPSSLRPSKGFEWVHGNTPTRGGIIPQNAVNPRS